MPCDFQCLQATEKYIEQNQLKFEEAATALLTGLEVYHHPVALHPLPFFPLLLGPHPCSIPFPPFFGRLPS